MKNEKIVVASCRGPKVSAAGNEGTQGQDAPPPEQGGLAGAMLRAVEVLLTYFFWFCFAQNEEEYAQETPVLGMEGKLSVDFVKVSRSTFTKFYDDFCNILWFLCHGMLQIVEGIEDKLEAWPAYVAANQAIAEAIAATSASVVLLQDYQLLLVARMLRQRLTVECPRLHQFIHISWPGPKMWKKLPHGIVRAIFLGMVANDVLAFHTAKDARNFLEGAREFLREAEVDLVRGQINLNLDGRPHTVKVNHYLISVDPADEVRKSLVSEMPSSEVGSRFQQLVGVGRLEPTKAWPEQVKAFRFLLSRHPELLGQVQLPAGIPA